MPLAETERIVQQARSERGWRDWRSWMPRCAWLLICLGASHAARGRGDCADPALAFESDAAEIPDSYWTVRPATPVGHERADAGVGCQRPAPHARRGAGRDSSAEAGRSRGPGSATGRPAAADLRMALSERPPRPLAALFELLPTGSFILGLVLSVAALLATLQVQLDVLLRSALHILGFFALRRCSDSAHRSCFCCFCWGCLA